MAAPSRSGPLGGPMPDRLLLVEDRENLRLLMAKALGARFDVEAVGDGIIAMQCLHERPFAVVVTDVRLPGHVTATTRRAPRAAKSAKACSYSPRPMTLRRRLGSAATMWI